VFRNTRKLSRRRSSPLLQRIPGFSLSLGTRQRTYWPRRGQTESHGGNDRNKSTERVVSPAIPRRLAVDGAPARYSRVKCGNVATTSVNGNGMTTRNLLHRREYPLARAPSSYLAAFCGVSRCPPRTVRGILLYQPNVPYITCRDFLAAEICTFLSFSLSLSFLLLISRSCTLTVAYEGRGILRGPREEIFPRACNLVRARVLSESCLSDLTLLYFFAANSP